MAASECVNEFKTGKSHEIFIHLKEDVIHLKDEVLLFVFE